jgi:hypothetical protein
MRTDAQAGGAGALRWRRPRLGLPRPSGIRNGGLLLVLVALAAVMALVDRPPEPGAGRSLPGVFQHLPPPAGITALPPVAEQPPAPPGTAGAAAPAGSGARPASVDRAHPNRQHPRPVDGGTGGQGGGNGTSQPPVTTPPVTAPVARVQVPPVNVRVKPPALLGRDLPEVRAETPSVTVDVPRLTATP